MNGHSTKLQYPNCSQVPVKQLAPRCGLSVLRGCTVFGCGSEFHRLGMTSLGS